MISIKSSFHTPKLQVLAPFHSTGIHDLLSLIKNSEFLISPDSGPIHLATCAGKPVIGLYGVTNTVRAGPYNSKELCIDKYNIALSNFTGRRRAREKQELQWNGNG